MVTALLTAAGTGTRMKQDIPKQFIHVDNKPVIIHTMEAFENHPGVDAIVVVTLESWIDVLWAYARQFNITKLQQVVAGGATGQQSIKCGLDAISVNADPDSTVIVHDGNRPLVSSEIISDSLATFAKYGNAVTAIPCVEVVFESEDGESSHVSLDRDKLYRTQTPHVYKLKDLLWAHARAKELNLTETAASCLLMKELGVESYFSKGSEENIKITTVDDLKIFKALLHTRHEDWLK